MWNEPYPPRPWGVHTPLLPELNTGVPALCLQGRQTCFHVGGWWLVLSIINKQKGQDPHYLRSGSIEGTAVPASSPQVKSTRIE